MGLTEQVQRFLETEKFKGVVDRVYQDVKEYILNVNLIKTEKAIKLQEKWLTEDAQGKIQYDIESNFKIQIYNAIKELQKIFGEDFYELKDILIAKTEIGFKKCLDSLVIILITEYRALYLIELNS